MVDDRGKSIHLRRSGVTATLAVLGISGVCVLATRVPFRTHYPFDFDCANYALAVADFDIPTHQPHPPGSPLFVLAARVLWPLTGDPHLALQVVVWLCSLAALWFTLLAVGRVSGSKVAAVVTLLTNPAFWFAGEIAEPYVCDAMLFAGAIAIAAGPERAGRARLKRTILLALFVSLGAGFRPSSAAFLLPICAVEAFRLRSWRATAGTLAVFGVGCGVWLFPMLADSGGLQAYMASYARLRPLFEERWEHHGWMVFRLALWTVAVAAPVLLFMLASARPRFGKDIGKRDLLWKTAIVIIPVWLFYATVHFADCLYIVAFCGPFAIMAGSFAGRVRSPSRGLAVLLIGAVQCGGFFLADRLMGGQFIGRTSWTVLKQQDERSQWYADRIKGCADDSPLLLCLEEGDWPHGARILQYLLPDRDFCLADGAGTWFLGRSFYRRTPGESVFVPGEDRAAIDGDQSICLIEHDVVECRCGAASEVVGDVDARCGTIRAHAP